MTAPDTIAALLAPAGPAALASIGVVGPGARAALEKLFVPTGGRLLENRPLYGWFGNTVKDDVVAIFAGAAVPPHAEIHCHGGLAMAPALLAELAAVGVPTAPWREYALRLGRTPFQCDALEALAAARGPRAAAILLDQLDGALDAALLSPAAAAEAWRWLPLGRRLERPFRVALCGPANAGKSSLLNALLGYARAIVAPAAGTTRDVLRAETALDGWSVELLDGAGFRSGPDEVEAAGAARLAAALAEADLRILVVDGAAFAPADLQLPAGLRCELLVANKADLAAAENLPAEAWRCSALTGAGVGELAARIAALLAPETPPPGAAVPFRAEHEAALSASRNISS